MMTLFVCLLFFVDGDFDLFDDVQSCFALKVGGEPLYLRIYSY